MGFVVSASFVYRSENIIGSETIVVIAYNGGLSVGRYADYGVAEFDTVDDAQFIAKSLDGMAYYYKGTDYPLKASYASIEKFGLHPEMMGMRLVVQHDGRSFEVTQWVHKKDSRFTQCEIHQKAMK